MRLKTILPAAIVSLALTFVPFSSSHAQTIALEKANASVESYRDSSSRASPANSRLSSYTPPMRTVPIDTLYLQMLRTAFLDEINKIRAEYGPTPKQRTPLVINRRYNSVGQKFCDTLATLPSDSISHDVTDQVERLSWLLPFAESNQECIHVGLIPPTSLSDTSQVEQAVRSAARSLFESDSAHARAILRPAPDNGLGGVGITFSETSSPGHWIETPSGRLFVGSGGLRLVVVFEVGGYLTEEGLQSSKSASHPQGSKSASRPLSGRLKHAYK